jgi:hypothetical protein
MMKIEIQEKLWYVQRGKEKLAYLTAFGTDAAFKKRSETGLSWAHGYRSEKINNEPVICPNELRGGFKIIDNVSRWSTSNVVWRVLDPLGFEVEIYSGNMMEIVKCAEIKNGEIMTKCIWGRESGKNVLLPESSEPYQSAVEFTKKKDVKIDVKDIHGGDFITLKNNIKYKYLGHFYGLFVSYEESNGARVLKTTPKKVYFLEHEHGKITTFASLTIIEAIVGVGVVTGYEKYTNDKLQKEHIYTKNSESIFAVSSDVPKVLTFFYNPCTYADIKKDMRYSYRANSFMVTDGIHDYLYTEGRGGYSSSSYSGDSVVRIKSLKPDTIEPMFESRRDWAGRMNVQYYTSHILKENITGVKRIEAIVDGNTYRVPIFA